MVCDFEEADTSTLDDIYIHYHAAMKKDILLIICSLYLHCDIVLYMHC